MQLASLIGGLEAKVARALFRLPHRVQVLLSGKSPVRIDGQTLHPELQLLLAARRLRGGAPLRAETALLARSRLNAEAAQYRGPKTDVKLVEELTVDGGAGPIPARHYVPFGAVGAPPLLVYFHGGGFVTGGLDSHDETCRILSATARIQVLSIDYRLAPEHPFPAAVEDAFASFQWACRNAERFGADPNRIAVGGDSAGGNLSAVVSQLARQSGGPAPALQVLIYPATDRVTPRPSATLFRSGFFLEEADMEWYDANYVGELADARFDPRVSPIRASDLSALCPAIVVTAGFDPLRDEGEAYAGALESAGNRVTLTRLGGFIHGFVNMTDVSPASKDALEKIARDVARSLGTDAARRG